MFTHVRNIAFSVVATALAVAPHVTLAAWNINQTQSNAQGFGLSTATPTTILSAVINYALAIIGFLGVLAFIISGIMYLVSAGDEKTASKAKGYMVYAIIGVVVALIGYVVMAAISSLLGAGGSTTGL
jgi:hypothetical protein